MSSPNYEDVFYLGYAAGYKQVPQERKNPFDGKVMMDTLEGKQKRYDDLGISTMRAKTSKFTQVVHSDNTFRSRWLTATPYYDAKLVDHQDMVALLADPTSAFMQSQLYAIERLKRDVVIGAFSASVDGGETPTTGTYAFNTTTVDNAAGRVVPDDADSDGDNGGTVSGMTIDKLDLVRQKFASLDIADGMPIYLACNYKQISDLVKEAETQSIDTNIIRSLVDGTITKFMGINFVITNGILGTSTLSSGATGYQCFAWIPEGVTFAQYITPSFKVDRRVDMVGDAWQIKVDTGLGAIRNHEDMVLRIDCA